MVSRIPVGIFVLAMAARLANIVSIHVSGGSFHIEDSPLYYAIVDDWVRFGHYVRIDEAGTLYREYERLPVYPAFLLGLEYFFGRSDQMVAIVQAFLDSLTCVIIMYAAAGYRPVVGMISGVVAALSPNMIISSSLVVNDTLFLFLLALSVFALLRFRNSDRAAWAVLSGLALGTATITRPILLYLLPFLGLGFFLFAYRKHIGWLGKTGRTAVFVVAFALPVAGVLQATDDAYGKPFLTRQGGVHLLGWVLPMTHPETRSLPQGAASMVWFERFKLAMNEQGLDPDQMSPVDVHEERENYALRELARVPLLDIGKAWIRGAALNLSLPAILYDGRVRNLAPGGFSQLPGSSILGKLTAYLSEADIRWVMICALAVLGAALFCFLQLAGAIIFTLRYPVIGISLLMVVGYILGILGPVFAAKYRLPIEPVLIFFSAVALAFWGRRFGMIGDAVPCRGNS